MVPLARSLPCYWVIITSVSSPPPTYFTHVTNITVVSGLYRRIYKKNHFVVKGLKRNLRLPAITALELVAQVDSLMDQIEIMALFSKVFTGLGNLGDNPGYISQAHQRQPRNLCRSQEDSSIKLDANTNKHQ